MWLFDGGDVKWRQSGRERAGKKLDSLLSRWVVTNLLVLHSGTPALSACSSNERYEARGRMKVLILDAQIFPRHDQGCLITKK